MEAITPPSCKGKTAINHNTATGGRGYHSNHSSPYRYELATQVSQQLYRFALESRRPPLHLIGIIQPFHPGGVIKGQSSVGIFRMG